MKLLLSQDLSKCRIDRSKFPKVTYLKKHFSDLGNLVLNEFNLFNSLKKNTVSVLFTNDSHIRKINLETRGKDKPTNVLSFPYMSFKNNGKAISLDEVYSHQEIIGDIVFGVDTCVKEAHEQSKTIEDHLSHLFVHSLLHLLGFDHIKNDEAKNMEKIEISILKKAGVKNPYS